MRARLLLITMVLLAVGLLVSTTAALVDLRRPLVERLDSQLRVMSAFVVGLEPVVRAMSALPRGGLPSGRTASTEGVATEMYLAFLAPDGRVEQVLRTGSSAGGPGPELPMLDTAATATHAGRPFDVPGKGGTTAWRVLSTPRPGGAGQGSVVVAAPLAAVEATVAGVAVRSAVVGGVVLMLLAVAGWYAVGAGLRPLRRVEETATAIAGGDLSRRVPELAAPTTEVGRLAVALNGMLGQVETAFAARAASEARMRRFVADASHELRTPLFSIRGFTELYRMGGLPERADVDRAMGRIESESGRLVALVEDLLLLARLDEHHGVVLPVGQLAPMDLRTLAADALHDLHAIDPSRPVRLTGPGAGPAAGAALLGDEARLRQVVSNLVGNVVAHTPAGTPVRIGVGTVDDHAVLEVADEGPGLSADQAAMVFERFYRVDRSRSRADGGGAGLGLAIAASIVAAHRGRVQLDTSPGAGATFRVLLPATHPD